MAVNATAGTDGRDAEEREAVGGNALASSAQGTPERGEEGEEDSRGAIARKAQDTGECKTGTAIQRAEEGEDKEAADVEYRSRREGTADSANAVLFIPQK